jgi:hypothetical protein
MSQPSIGALELPPISNILVENAELVPKTVPDRRNLKGRERVHETRRQATETPVAQPRLLLVLEQIVQIHTQPLHRLASLVRHAERQHVVAQLRTHQELSRHVTDGSARAGHVSAGGPYPSTQQQIANRVGERQVQVVVRRHRRELGLSVIQVLNDAPAEVIDALGGRGNHAEDIGRHRLAHGPP